jgi:hypothetical protein
MNLMETGMLNQTTVNAPSYTSTKRYLTSTVCLPKENTIKSNTYMRMDFV